MEVRQAQTFLAVAEELHFGRAADRLRMAQPPLSRMIKQLERDLKAELFLRSTRRVELTPVGKALIGPAKELVAASAEAVMAVSDAKSGRTGHIRIGFAGASTYGAIGKIFRKIRDGEPGLTLNVESSMFSPDGLIGVVDKKMDMAIGRWDFLPAELDSHMIAQEEVIVALSPRHPLAQAPSVSIQDLANDSWVSLPVRSGSALQNRLTQLAMGAGFVPRITQSAPDSWAQLVLVSADIGCAMTVNSVRQNLPELDVVYKPIADSPNPPLEVRLIWRKDNLTPAVTTVIDIAQQLFSAPRVQ